MQKNSTFFDDLAKMMSGAAGGMLEAKREMEAVIAERVELLLRKMQLVTREDYDTLKEMHLSLLKKHEELEKTVAELKRLK